MKDCSRWRHPESVGTVGNVCSVEGFQPDKWRRRKHEGSVEPSVIDCMQIVATHLGHLIDELKGLEHPLERIERDVITFKRIAYLFRFFRLLMVAWRMDDHVTGSRRPLTPTGGEVYLAARQTHDDRQDQQSVPHAPHFVTDE